MSFRQTQPATLRFAGLFAVLVSLLLAPVSGASVAALCSAPAEVAMDCGGCCDETVCCPENPAQPAPPAIPAPGHNASADFCIALMAANRPLLGLLPAGRQDFISTARAPLGRSRDSLALLCVRLI